MNRMAQWISLGTILASFLVGMAVANAQQYYGPASGPHAMAGMGPSAQLPVPQGMQPIMPPYGQSQPMMAPMSPYGPMMSPYPGMQAAYQQSPQAPGMMFAELQPPAPLEYPNDVSPAGTYTGGKGKSGKAAKSGNSGPTWTVGGGVIYMKRSKPYARSLWTSPAGTTILDASEFNFDFESGYEFQLERHMANGLDLEGRYMQIDGWNAVNSVDFPGGGGTIVTNPPTTIITPNNRSLDSNYNSRLKSAEINAWQRVHPWARIGTGVRWIGLDDQLVSIVNQGALPVTVLDINATNNMYGLQLVGDGMLWANGRFTLEANGRAGIFAAESKQTVSIFEPQAPSSILNGQANANGWAPAFAGEVGVFGIFNLTENIAFRAGYQGMWIEGIALASDQLDNTSNLGVAPRQTTVDSGGGIFAHGGVLSIQISL